MPLKATSAGLSINEATHVFLLDTGLSRQDEVQALARVRRVNSTRPTAVHRLVMEGTLESAIWALLSPEQEAAAAEAAASAAASAASVEGLAGGLEGGAGSGTKGSGSAVHEVRRGEVVAMFRRFHALHEAPGHAAVPPWRERLLRGLDPHGPAGSP